ncbi:hypothetical protein MAAFP003_500 [Mycobacterium ahvazicum]|uniref:Uncharacterized protein n=1 Tax=Mycobacterium ahvazicum TaxID=1964395 RepID=A0A2K4Y4X6_9MYCO|nr:hypothetical protein MAAFP003_500 [Mycobacterium ahvazicum]
MCTGGGSCTTTGGGCCTTTGGNTGRGGAWITGGLISHSGAGMRIWGTGIGTTTGAGTAGAIGAGAAGSGGSATGAGAAGNGAANAGRNGLGAATGAGRTIFGCATDASAGGGADAGCVGTMRFWLGLGCTATFVVRMPMASAISSATTALMAITAIPLPTNSTGLRRGPPAFGTPKSDGSITTVGASASSSDTRL